MTGMKHKRSIVWPDRDSGNFFRTIASFSAPVLGGEDVGLKRSQQSHRLELPELLVGIVDRHSQSLLHFQEHIGQVGIDFPPGSHEWIAGRGRRFETQLRAFLGGGIVSSIFARRPEKKQMHLPDAGELKEKLKVSRRDAGWRKNRDPLWQIKPDRAFKSAGAQTIQGLIETRRFTQPAPQGSLPGVVSLSGFPRVRPIGNHFWPVNAVLIEEIGHSAGELEAF